MNKLKIFCVWLVLPILIVFTTGCGVVDYYFLSPPEDTAQELSEAGMAAMQEKNYGQAIEYFTKLKERYPFSPYTPRAELSLADAYFLDEQYRAAVDMYKEFESLHPRDEAIPYVLFQIGLSNLKQFKSIDRPQQNISEALQYFYRLQETFPGTKYAEKANEHIIQCKRHQAEHEIFVADFYWRTKRYAAAWRRYQYVQDNFPELTAINAYAQKRCQIAYFKAQKKQSQQIRESKEGSWKQFFDWL
jgi:outer membrane protein assembly factor BamD